jgi:hypothetical protein
VYKEKDPVFTPGLSNSILKGKESLLIGGIKLMNYIINSSTKLHAYINTTAGLIVNFHHNTQEFPMNT